MSEATADKLEKKNLPPQHLNSHEVPTIPVSAKTLFGLSEVHLYHSEVLGRQACVG